MSVFIVAQASRDEENLDHLPRRIGPFTDEEAANAYMHGIGPVYGSWYVEHLTAPDLDGATDVGDEGAYPSGAGEFAARWNTANPETRDRIAASLNLASEQAFRCTMRRHDAVLSITSAQKERLVKLVAKLMLMEPTAELVPSAWVETTLGQTRWLVVTLLAMVEGGPVDWDELAARIDHLTREAVQKGSCRIPHPKEVKRVLTDQEAMAAIHSEANDILRQVFEDRS